ncbi:uncharacterized protein IL334_006786 [Kwoniella shivajii]|uniref:PXA domain-containing protein n=1 Tax=Kwoniella shivajii TaxID=564305 RepID=A0ABZ1D796_9TREE|nr:hypothetical protein IL334_006786 [Kwoniella shivajii]
MSNHLQRPSTNRPTQRSSTVTTTTTTTTLPAIAPSLIRSKSTIHLPLYRRILYPHDDPSSIIPKIVIGEGDEIDLINERLHHLIALALRGYVLSWYSRFTPNRALPSSINKSIIHPILSPILTSIYDNPDQLIYFILVDLPVIINIHLRTYYHCIFTLKSGSPLPLPLSSSSSSSSWREKNGDHCNLEDIYHNHLPLLSVSYNIEQVGYENGCECGYGLSPIYLSALSTCLLSNYVGNQPDVERLMSREILSKSILGSIGRKLIQNWFWYSIILKLLGEPNSHSTSSSSITATSTSTSSSNQLYTKEGDDKYQSIDQLIMKWSTRLISIFVKIWGGIISLIAIYSASKDYGPKYGRCYEPILLLTKEILGVDGRNGLYRRNWPARMIWGMTEMIVSLSGGVLDRILPHLIHTVLLTPETSLKLIDLVEKILFPDGYPGPSPPDPTRTEVVDLKIRAEKRIDEIIPSFIKYMYFSEDGGGGGTKLVLDAIVDKGCNSHLVAMILTSLVGTVIPDLVVEQTDYIETNTTVDTKVEDDFIDLGET